MLFIPEGKKGDSQIPADLHDRWTVKLLMLCTDSFGGATSYGRGVGAWKAKNGKIHWDRITVVETWISPDDPKVITRKLNKIVRNLIKMRAELKQKSVAYILNDRFKEVNPNEAGL